ncbi:EamA family transporter [Acinetobacter haemolyticus]|uniref:DMT family transporter n=1 Tax=Acinetobacter haemolyticus TaxID=29430 RepID=UPI001372F5A9|nr:DMT family transporter [Acinetobacter haemolyticus]NAR63779.1 EamA family transporter [Acinetobacter haemolyticus]
MGQLYKYQKWAFVLPLIAVLIWSLNIAVTRYVADYISPVSISFYRWLVAFLILTPFMLPKIWQQRALIRPLIPKLAVLSAFGMVLYQGLSYAAAHYTTATNMGIVNAFVPIFTIFISYLILKDRPNRFAILGSVLSFAGLLYVMGQGHISSLFMQGGHWGDAVMVLAVGFYAFYGVFLKKWQLKLPLMTSLYVQIGFALVYHLPFLLWFGLDWINAENAASIIYAGVFPSLIAPLLWMLAVQVIGPNRTSIFMNLMPVFTAIIASFWLAESWTIYHSIGGFMILVGIILAQKKSLKLPSRALESTT